MQLSSKSRFSRAPQVSRLIVTALLVPVLLVCPLGFLFCLAVHLIALRGSPLHVTTPWVYTLVLLCEWGLPFFSGAVFVISLIGRGDKQWERKLRREWRGKEGFDRWFQRIFLALVVVGMAAGINSWGHVLYESEQNSHGTVQVRDGRYAIVYKSRVVRSLSHEEYLWHASLTLRRDSSWGMFGCLIGGVFLTISLAALHPPQDDEVEQPNSK